MTPQPADRILDSAEYAFATTERIIQEKQAKGVDVIKLGIGDPVEPTYAHIIAAMQEAVANPENHQYPSNRGRAEFRGAMTEYYDRRFGVELDADTEVVAAIGAKECIFNLNLAYLNPGDVALAADPGYPVYTEGPRLVGAEAVRMPLVPELGFVPDLRSMEFVAQLDNAKLMYLNYPNNPTGAVAPEGFFEDVVAFADRNNILVVHDNSYSEIVYDGKTAPSFLATPGAKDIGVEVFSLSKGFNMTGWRSAAIVGNAEVLDNYHKLKTNIDSGNFEAVQLASAEALRNSDEAIAAQNKIYTRRRDLVVEALQGIGIDVEPPEATIYVWAPVPEGHTSESFVNHVLEETGVVLSKGTQFGEAGEGFFRISLTAEDERIEEAVKRIGDMEAVAA